MFIGTFQGRLNVECYMNKGPSTGLQMSGATTVINESVPRAFTQCTIAQARVFLHTMRKCMRCDIHDTDLQEALFTVLQASFHMIKGPTACMRVVGILRRITDIAFHYHTMRQQQLSYVRPADVCSGAYMKLLKSRIYLPGHAVCMAKPNVVLHWKSAMLQNVTQRRFSE